MHTDTKMYIKPYTLAKPRHTHVETAAPEKRQIHTLMHIHKQKTKNTNTERTL